MQNIADRGRRVTSVTAKGLIKLAWILADAIKKTSAEKEAIDSCEYGDARIVKIGAIQGINPCRRSHRPRKLHDISKSSV